MSSPRAWIATTCLVLLASCAPIEFFRQEVHLVHDAEKDTLRMLIVYDGIRPTSQTPADKDDAKAFAERVQRREREFVIWQWPLHAQLEGFLTEEETAGEDDAWDPWKREMRAALRSMRVRDAGYCKGIRGDLSLYQDLEFANASAIVELLDRALRQALEESLAKGTFDADGELDATTREAWIRLAKEKRRWLSVEKGVLAVELPMSASGMAKLVSKWAQLTTGDHEVTSVLAALTSHLSEIEIGDGRVRAAWKLGGPVFTYFADPAPTASQPAPTRPKFPVEAPADLPSLEDVIAAFGKP